MTARAPVLRASPPMGEDDFMLWAGLLERRSGIRWSRSQRSFLETRLRMRMREIGFEEFRPYYDFVRTREPKHTEWSVLLDRLTIHESHFFRHPPSFDLIRNHGLAWLERSRSPSRIRAWSVGCATGEEPYTLAMVIDDALRRPGLDHEFHVIGSDISVGALATARAGRYARAKVKEVPPLLRERYFVPEDAENCRVTQHLRQRVLFLEANVVEGGLHCAQESDLVMCQNVLIYFSRDVRLRILDTLVHSLAPGGLLVLGPGEMVHWSHPLLRRESAANTLAFARTEGSVQRGGG